LNQRISRGKLFTFRDLQDIDGEGTGAKENWRTKIPKSGPFYEKNQGENGFQDFPEQIHQEEGIVRKIQAQKRHGSEKGDSPDRAAY
jgi:hypothetical protein